MNENVLSAVDSTTRARLKVKGLFMLLCYFYLGVLFLYRSVFYIDHSLCYINQYVTFYWYRTSD